MNTTYSQLVRIGQALTLLAVASAVIIAIVPDRVAATFDHAPKLCAPGDAHYNPEHDLSGYLAGGGTGVVTNHSKHCHYEVGLAVYEKFDEVIDNQEIYDFSEGVVKAKNDITLHVDLPDCAYQIDLFYGDVLQSLDGQRYGDRLLKADHRNDGDYCHVVPAPSCDAFAANPASIEVGESTTLAWATTNAVEVSIDNGVGAVDPNGSTSVTPTESTTYTLTAANVDGVEVSCEAPVVVTEPAPSCDFFGADPGNIQVGDSTTLTWATTNATEVTISGIGSVDPNGSTTVSPSTSTTYTLTAENVAGDTVSCEAPVSVTEVPAPSCDAFTATPSSVLVGGTVTLDWQTTNATEVRINNAIGVVPADGSTTVSGLSTSTTFVLTVFGTNGQEVSCEAPVTVTQAPAPSCDAFAADPATIEAGESTTLTWATTNALNVTIDNGVGAVDPNGSTSVSPTESTTYTLTAENVAGDTVSCEAPVTIAEEPPFTCESAVEFSAAPRSIDEGDATTLTWSTTDVDSLTISNTNFTALSGSESVRPNRDTTYTLRATRGDETISCPVSVSVDEDDGGGGGGGGSNSPICELEASLTRIDRGDEVTLTWETSRATEVIIEDDNGDTIITTEDLMLKDKRDLFDGSTTVSPTETTTYTLLATRGSRDVDCEVRVRVSGDEPEEEDEIVVLESRDQEPLVAGISLTEVPYTGFEAGPILTFLFYVVLVAWSAFLAYFFINRQEPGTGSQLAATTGPQAPTPHTDSVTESVWDATEAAGVSASAVTAPARTESAPINLPTGTPVIGYANYADTDAGTVEDTAQGTPAAGGAVETDVAALEAHAHTRSALVSSDALRQLMTSAPANTDHTTLLDTVISAAKAAYPAEDGWTVINATRMRELCEQCTAPAKSTAAPHAPAVVPQGAGSLAEALASGHVAAAYALIDQRPMFALADAASEFDEIVRARREGRTPNVSELLATEATKLSDTQLQNIIDALTGALDGTYTDEAAAVKMAIMKAAKQVA